MVIGATELCHIILESCCRAKQPWQTRFLILWLGPDFRVVRVGTQMGANIFLRISQFFMKRTPPKIKF